MAKKPTRSQVRNAVFYAVAQISQKAPENFTEDMFLGKSGRDDKNVKHKGVGFDQEACDAVANLLNLIVKHRVDEIVKSGAGKGKGVPIRKGKLTPTTTLEACIEVTQKCFANIVMAKP